MRRLTKAGRAPDDRKSCPENEQDGARPRARIQSGPNNAAKGGVLPPPTITGIASALPELLTATAAPEMTWLPLNVA
eukprot:scaffold121936_cov69-Phaeocystis_antarctica.AAC.1